MKEAKFRVWDKIAKEMMLPAKWEEDYVGGGNKKIGLYIYRSKKDPNQHSSLDWVFKHPEFFDVMQYTGIKDDNSKEIYDGDIVKLCYGIPPTYDTLVIEYADDETVADIAVSGWWMRNIRKNGCSSSLCKTYENDIEIIGNIHEHPELER